MGASSYPAMTQPFSMSHSSNMSSVGVRQDSMSEYKMFIFFNAHKKLFFRLCKLKKIRSER